jgi:hypothetical protein
MCLIKCAFVGENNFNIIKMHGTTIKKCLTSLLNGQINFVTECCYYIAF